MGLTNVKLGTGEYAFLAVISLLIVLPLSKQLFFTLLITYAALWILKRRKYNKFWDERGVPGPKPNFFLGNIMDYIDGVKEPDIRNQEKYGLSYGTFSVVGPEFVVADPDILTRILVKDFGFFSNHLDFFPQTDNSIVSNMVFALKDQRWKEIRSVLTPTLTTAKLKAIVPLIYHSIESTKSVIQQCIDEENGKINVEKITSDLVADIMSKWLLGVDMDMYSDNTPEKIEFVKKIHEFFDFSVVELRLYLTVIFPNFAFFIQKYLKYEIFNNHGVNYFKKIIQKLIEERLQNSVKKGDDFIQLLINASVYQHTKLNGDIDTVGQKMNDKSKAPLNEVELMAQILTMFTAAFETTMITLQYAFYSLAVNLNIQEKIYNEIIETVGQEGKINYEAISKMVYLDQVIHEIIRIYPAVGRTDRICSSDIEINGIKFSKDVLITIPIFAMHFNPNIYPQPENFDPERFSVEERAKRNPLTFMPFGFGPRVCMGKRLALLETKMIVAALVKDFVFSTNDYSQGSLLPISTTGMTKPLKTLYLNVAHRKW